LKKGREEEGEDRKEAGKGGSTRPFLAREPNSSTASNYEPASQTSEKGKLAIILIKFGYIPYH